eukprot:476335-Pyramimonas_sp.AAC.1
MGAKGVYTEGVAAVGTWTFECAPCVRLTQAAYACYRGCDCTGVRSGLGLLGGCSEVAGECRGWVPRMWGRAADKCHAVVGSPGGSNATPTLMCLLAWLNQRGQDEEPRGFSNTVPSDGSNHSCSP